MTVTVPVTTFGIDVEAQNNTPSASKPSNYPYNNGIGLTLEQFRVLVGIPQDSSSPFSRVTPSINRNNQDNGKGPFQRRTTVNDVNHLTSIAPPTIRTPVRNRSCALDLLGLLTRLSRASLSKSEQSENPTSIYFSLRREESDQHRLFHFYNLLTYTCLILQLVIASALIIIGAIPSTTSSSGNDDGHLGYRVAVAVLGGITGLLTGVLSLLKGQGMPIRFLQYAGRLRQVREQIEFTERILRASMTDTVVTYQDVLKIWQDYENVFVERDINRPDAWATLSGPSNSQGTDLRRNGILSAKPSPSGPGSGSPGRETHDEQRKEQQ